MNSYYLLFALIWACIDFPCVMALIIRKKAENGSSYHGFFQ